MQAFKPLAEGWVVNVERQRKDLPRDLRADLEHPIVECVGINAEPFVQLRPCVVTNIHRRVDREDKEPNPQLVNTLQQLRVGAHD
jgi:hypothetical protein